MFNRIVISICNQMTGAPLSKSDILVLVDSCLLMAKKTYILIPQESETITDTARQHRAIFDSMNEFWNTYNPENLKIIYSVPVATMVRDGYKADIAIGDDLALAITRYKKLPVSVQNMAVSRASMSTTVFQGIVKALKDYVVEYDEADQKQKPNPRDDDFARGQVDPRAIAAAQYAASHHEKASIGYCARYVRTALQKGGFTDLISKPSAYMYAKGELERLGFTRIDRDGAGELVGDVIVYDRNAKYPHGHIAIRTSKGWVSDFHQPFANPYRIKSTAGVEYYYRAILAGSVPKGRAIITETRRYESKDKRLKLKDIVINRESMREISQRSSKSVSLGQFSQLLQDLSNASNLTFDVMKDLSKYENGYPNTPAKLLNSSGARAGGLFVGPFQLGGPHWVDSRQFILDELGVTVPVNRGSASIAAQGVASIIYVMTYAQRYSTLGNQILTPELFYLIHNMGPTGALGVLSTSRKIPASLIKNASKQSDEVRALIGQFNPALGRLIGA